MDGWLSWASVRCSLAKRSRRAGESHASRRILRAATLPRSSRIAQVHHTHAALAEHVADAIGPEPHRCAALPAPTAARTVARDRARSRSSNGAPCASASRRLWTSGIRPGSSAQAISRKRSRSAAGRSAASWKSCWIRSQRACRWRLSPSASRAVRARARPWPHASRAARSPPTPREVERLPPRRARQRSGSRPAWA